MSTSAVSSDVRPQDWWDSSLRTHLGDTGRPHEGTDWVTAAELDGDRLAALHAAHVADGATAPAAAKWICAWFAGGAAGAVGFTLATTSAALVLREQDLRWRLHPENWPEQIDVGPAELTVAAAHRWAGRPGVAVVETQQAVHELALRSVVGAAQALVERIRPLAKVGRPALWAEVADGFALAVAHRLDPAVDEAALARLRGVLELPAAPWRSRPRLVAGRSVTGPSCLAQKGGCCLAYQCTDAKEAAAEADPEDGYAQVVADRFPSAADAPEYCTTCSLRTFEDCAGRQQLWFDYYGSG